MRIQQKNARHVLAGIILGIISIIGIFQAPGTKSGARFHSTNVETNIGAEYFSNFSPSTTNISAPNCTVVVNSTIAYPLVNNSDGFYYSKNGMDTSGFVNAHEDLFDSGGLESYWTTLNAANGIFSEAGGRLTITDGGSHGWGNEPGLLPKYDAPALVQAVWGDFNVSISINSSKIDAAGKQAGLLYRIGNSLVRFIYTLSPTNVSQGILRILQTENGFNTIIEEEPVLHGGSRFLKLTRKGDFFSFYTGLSPVMLDLVSNTTLFMNRAASIGIYAGTGGVLECDEWRITPRVEMNLASDHEGIMRAINVPFNQYDDDNYIWFSVNSSALNFTSNPFKVSIDCSEGLISFENYQPKETDDTTPDMSFFMPINQTGFAVPNISVDSCYFAYTRDGSRPNRFINPHKDWFGYDLDSAMGDHLPAYWNVTNETQLQFKVVKSETTLYLNDTGNSTWNESVQNAPHITQSIHGDFTIIAKFLLTPPSNYSGGIFLYINSSYNFLFDIERLSLGNPTVTVLETNGGAWNKSASTNITDMVDNELWLKIRRSGTKLEFLYSTTGQSYSFYFTIATKELEIDEIFDVGLLVHNNRSLTVNYWDITPSINTRTQLNIEYYFYLNVINVPFNQYSDDLNVIRVQITDIYNTTSTSNAFCIKIRRTSMNGVYVLYSDGNNVNLISYSKEIAWTYYKPFSFDKEYTQDGNFLITSGLPGSGEVELISWNKQIIRHITSAGGLPLDWPHDADLLPNGNILVADTGNNRAVEIAPNGTVVWQWKALDHFSPASGKSHLNDVDRLENGNTLITLRDLNAVVEVAMNGSIVWSYGGLSSSLLLHPHNADRLTNGTTIICDSERGQVIAVSPAKDVIWTFKPTTVGGVPLLAWPRDADLLPNNLMLVSDSLRNTNGSNTVYLFDMQSSRAIWSVETSEANYDADLVLLEEPTVSILSPGNSSYFSRKVDIILNLSSIFNDAYFTMFDNTTDEFVTEGAVQYYTPMSMTLEDMHQYTILAWSNNSGGLGGGYPQDDSTRIPSGPTSSMSFSIDEQAVYPEDQPFPGTTLLVSDTPPVIYEVDAFNRTLWSMVLPLDDDSDNQVGFTFISSIDLMPNNHALVTLSIVYFNSYMTCEILEINRDKQIVWSYKDRMLIIPESRQIHGYHDSDYIQASDTFLIADTRRQQAIEVNRSGQTTWSWNPFDHFSFDDVNGTISWLEKGMNVTHFASGWQDWFHLNDADRLPNGNTLISLRDINLIVEVNPAGDIIWSFGDPDNTSTMRWQHNPVRLSNNHTLICDSSHNRIIEIDENKNIVWNTNSFPWLGLNFPRGTERLPNGNTLISDSFNNRNIEITPAGKIVWEFPATLAYDADRIDRFSPWVSIDVPENANYPPGIVPVTILAEARDLNTTWFNIFDETNRNWLFANTTIVPNATTNITLPIGTYSLHAWANDTFMDSVEWTSDHSSNIEHQVVHFMVAEDPAIILRLIILYAIVPLTAIGCVAIVVNYIKRRKVYRSKAQKSKTGQGPGSIPEGKSDAQLNLSLPSNIKS
nr:aryl-sulfate sulfotransferase [Candidatus Sigynarchaeota archaeon]